MGCWDELCLVCGVCGDGPRALLHKSSIDKEAEAIAKDIVANKPHDKTPDELQEIVRESLAATGPDDWTTDTPWVPRGLGRYSEMHDVAIGHFDPDTGECPLKNNRFPRGKGVEVLRVAGGIDSGTAEKVICEVDGKNVEVERYLRVTSRERNPNLAVCGHCYHYLEAWLDWSSFPPRSCAFPASRKPLPYAGEFYEIVNSRKRRRSDRIPAILPELNYDGITRTLEQWQDFYIGARRGAKHTAKAIQAGLRGTELIPALLRDSRAWMFVLANLYPEPPETDGYPTFTEYSPSTNSNKPGFSKLPNELLLPILVQLPLASLSFLDLILRESVANGALRWLLPVEAVANDDMRAYSAVRLWFPEDHRPGPLAMESAEDKDECGSNEPQIVPAVKPLFASPHFPRLAFIRECWNSDSMMNRKRLWGQAKQFDDLWRDYRTHGWRVNRFYGSRPTTKTDKAVPVE